MVQSSRIDWGDFVMRPYAPVLAWAAFVVVSLAIMPILGMHPVGPDDYMRILEVRDLLAGQSWWDVNQYRINPPDGASMHWSRLVDLPLLLVAALFGETAALIAVPLLYLLVALFALRTIMQRLGFGPLAMGFGLAILPLFPFLPAQFAPFRIDHHAPQAVLAVLCAAALIQQSRISAVLGGLAAAVWVVVSLEGLPMVAAMAAILGLTYLWGADKRLPYFLGSLAIAAPVLSLASRPVSAFSPYCDILLPGHMAAFALAALASAIIPFLPGQGSARGRFIALCLIPVAAVPVAFLTLGECAINPMEELDPVVQQFWHGFITEGLPIWRQAPSVAATLVWTIVLVAAGWWIAGKNGAFDGDRGLSWSILAMLALAAGLYSMLLMREGVMAQLLTIPFAAYLLAHFMPRARAIESSVPRILATLACIFLATPTFASGAFSKLDPLVEKDSLRGLSLQSVEGLPCDYTRLNDLEPGHLLVPLDNAPQIIATTDHTIIMASYHRNQQGIADVVRAFSGDVESAHSIALENEVDYVVGCSSAVDMALYRSMTPEGFANALFSDEAPQWLQGVEGFNEGSLRVYRVRQP